MKRERNDDDDARAPGSPPRGLEREKKIQKFCSFLESSSCTTPTTTRHNDGKRSLSQKLITFYYDFRTIQTTTTEEEKKKLKKKKTIKKRATTIENEGEGRTKTNRSRPTAATTAPSSLYTARRTGTICSPPRKTAPAVCGIARAASASRR